MGPIVIKDSQKAQLRTMASSKWLELSVKDGIAIARVLVPELTDVDQVDALYDRIQQVIAAEETPRLVISLKGVRFLCSSAIAKLCAMFRQVVAKKHGKLAICCLSPEIAETLRLMRLDKLLPLFSSEDESLASVRP